MLKRKNALLINTIVALIGIIFVLLSVLTNNSMVKEFSVAIGIGLFAAGGVNILNTLFVQEEKEEATISKMIAGERKSAQEWDFERKYHAEKVDIIGISLLDCLLEIVNDPGQKMIDRVLFNRTRLRLVFVHPNAQYLTQRAIEDKVTEDSLRTRQRQSVKLSVAFYKLLNEAYKKAKRHDKLNSKRLGSIEIKLIEFCPYMTVNRADDEILWGLYTSDTAGINSPMFQVTEKNNILFRCLKNHIYALLERNLTPGGDYYLVRMINGAPVLNKKLVLEILEAEKLDMLLG